MGRSLLVALALAGCNPFGGAREFHCDTNEDCQGSLAGTCEPNGFCSFNDPTCGTDGRRYGDLAGNLSGTCVNGNVGEDAMQPEAGDRCFGSAASGGLVQPCFATEPTGSVTLTADINTNDACATVSNTTACVLAGGSITVPAGTQIRVTGNKPLVLVAVTSITIDGTIDAASHIADGTTGPGANDGTCDAGTAPGVHGGGAGGSFGLVGGSGGATNPGMPGAAAATVTLRGGCRGQDGSEDVAGTRGIGGAGGGAIYLIAQSISIGSTGAINASGAGGTNGMNNLASGGGGGSGGLIGLEAPTLNHQGLLLANGGGGGEGSGVNNPGLAGSDPLSTLPAAPGAGGSGNGGDGGAGGAIGNAARNGSSATSSGGGGGGVGVLRVIPAKSLTNVSPPPT